MLHHLTRIHCIYNFLSFQFPTSHRSVPRNHLLFQQVTTHQTLLRMARNLMDHILSVTWHGRHHLSSWRKRLHGEATQASSAVGNEVLSVEELNLLNIAYKNVKSSPSLIGSIGRRGVCIIRYKIRDRQIYIGIWLLSFLHTVNFSSRNFSNYYVTAQVGIRLTLIPLILTSHPVFSLIGHLQNQIPLWITRKGKPNVRYVFFIHIFIILLFLCVSFFWWSWVHNCTKIWAQVWKKLEAVGSYKILKPYIPYFFYSMMYFPPFHFGF